MQFERLEDPMVVLLVIGLILAVVLGLACSGMSKPEQGTSSPKQAYDIGAQFQREAPDGGRWQPMSTAPRDGTIVETKNTYGVAPTFNLSRWTDEGFALGESGREPHRFNEKHWVQVDGDGATYSEEGQDLFWRPYAGDPAAYVDPTKGAQHDSGYWRGAIAAQNHLPADYYEGLAEANRRETERFGGGKNAPYWPTSKLNGNFTLHRGAWVDDSVALPSNAVLDKFREEHLANRKAVEALKEPAK